jgi:Carboxypeptidase regulatory-like domain
MERIVKPMTNAKPIVTTAAVLFAGMTIARAGVEGYSTIPAANPARAGAAQQEAHPPAAAAPVAQDPPRSAATKPATDLGPLAIQAEVVDSRGYPLPVIDVGVTIRYVRGSDPAKTVFERTKSNGQGQARLEVARYRPIGLALDAYVWAYEPGRSAAATMVNLRVRTPPPPVRLTLEEPAKWTITVRDADDRPLAGLRIAPYALRPAGRRSFWLTVPDEWVDRLTTTTDAEGTAAPTCLPPNMQLLAIRVAGPGVAPHALAISASPGTGALKLGRPGRLAGIVRTATGQPLADVPVEVWVRESGDVPESIANRPITPTEPLRFEPPSLKTGLQGAFQTPPTLLNGSAYRVSIRHDGYLPFLSDWVTLDGERTTVAPIRLEPYRTLRGKITDRQGRAVAGARVFLAGHGLAVATDAEGRFSLGGVKPGKTVLLAERAGFRLRGWPVEPSAIAEMGSLTLVHMGESPEPVIKPMAEAMPREKSRALADELLGPLLRDEKNQQNDHMKLAGIAALGAFDPDRALDLLQSGEFQKDNHYAHAQAEIAAKLAEKDSARATTLVEAIPDSRAKVDYLVDVAKALPASQRDRKNALLEQAANAIKDLGSYRQLYGPLPAIAEQWLDLGERDRARLLLQKGMTSYDSVRSESAGTLPEFLMQLARLEPDQAVERLRKLPDLNKDTTRPPLYDSAAAVAVGLAIDHPAEAERALNLWKRSGIQILTNHYVMQLCYRLARVDPTCARRVAMAQRGPAERALAWAYVALGLAEKEKTGAAEAVDHAIEEIDRLRESGPGPEPIQRIGGVLSMYPTNPAALILPVVERAAPDQLDDVFWRAVALHPRLEADQERDLQNSYLGFGCILLARYDRAVAAALFTPMDAYLRSLAELKDRRNAFASSHLVAKGCIDPRAASALLDSLTPPGPFDPPLGDYDSSSNPAHSARITLAKALGQSPEKRWKYLWSRMRTQLPLDD